MMVHARSWRASGSRHVVPEDVAADPALAGRTTFQETLRPAYAEEGDVSNAPDPEWPTPRMTGETMAILLDPLYF